MQTRRRWPWIVAAGLAAVVIGAAIALPLLLDVERYRGRIEAALGEATGWQAELGDIGFSVWRGLVVTVHPARLAAPGDSSRLDIDTLVIRAAVVPLLRGRLEIHSVDLVRPKIHFVRPTRALGWVVPRPDVPATTDPPSEGEGPIAVTIASVRVTDGTLVVDDRASAPPWVVTLAEVRVRLEPIAGTVEGSGRLEPGSARLGFSGSLAQGLAITLAGLPTETLHPFLGTGLIHAGGTLSGEARLTLPPTIQGTITGRSITLLAGEVPLDEMRATFAVRGGGATWVLESLALEAGGVQVTGGGPLVPAVDLRFTLPETPLEAALATAPSILPLPLDLRPPGSVHAEVHVVQPVGRALGYTAAGELSAARFVVSELLPPAENVRAAFALGRDGAFEARILEGTIAGGPATGVARLSSIDPPGKLTFDGALEDAAFGALLGGLVDRTETITGPTGLAARLGLDLARPTVDARALSGRLDLDSRDVRFPGLDLERAVLGKIEERLGALGAVAALVGQSMGREGPAAAADEAGGDARELLKTLTASVNFDRWPWGLERLGFEANDLAASGAGTLDPESGAVNLELIARLSPQKTTRLVSRYQHLRTLVDRDGRLALPVKVRGALLSPSVEVDLRRALSGGEGGSSTQDAVQGLIEGLFDRKNKKKAPSGN